MFFMISNTFRAACSVPFTSLPCFLRHWTPLSWVSADSAYLPHRAQYCWPLFFFFFYPCLPAINPLVTLFSPLQTHAVSCFPETPVLILQHTTKQDGNRERRRERGRDQIKSQTHKLKTLRELTFVGFQSLIWKTVTLLQQHKVPQLKKMFQLCYTAQHDCKYYPISSDIPLLFTLRTTALWGNEKKSNPKENLVCSESV